jgi:excisionase family DNA binding protein
METLLVDKRAAARALSISIRGLERLIRQGQLPAIRLRGLVRIPVAALMALAGDSRTNLFRKGQS